nr:hypothetical protein [uncultured Bdellovibrio sp.]
MMKLIFSIVLVFTSSWAWASGDFRTYFEEKNKINQQGDLAAIKYFHSKWATSQYVVINKKEKTAILFGEQNQVLSKASIRVYPGDELEKGGAGIYIYSGAKQAFHYGKAEKDDSVHALFLGNFSLHAGTPIYVLPESTDHRFRIRNQTLTFGAAQVLRNRPAFNYSPLNVVAKNSEMSVDFTDRFTRKYVQALQEEKKKLMELLHIENDEYNMLAEFAFGVLSPETDYGTSWKYRLKQTAPVVVSVLKGNGFDTSANSRGPTQIKNIPDVITEHYHIEKSELRKPENAAITTLAFAAEQLKELRNMASSHKEITEETLQDYLYYLYNGRRNEIKKATATPEKNILIQKIKEAIRHFHIEEV